MSCSVRRAVISLVLVFSLLLPASAFWYADMETGYEYAREAVRQMYTLGIMQGSVIKGGRLFRPDEWLERQEFFKITYSLNHAGRTNISTFYEAQLAQSDLVDLDDVSPWAKGYAGYNLVNRFFIGNNYRELLPRSPLSYMECTIVLLRMLGYSASALARVPGENLSDWQTRLFSYAEVSALFEGIPQKPTAGAFAAKPVIRADAAVLLSNALAAPMVVFIASGEGGEYLPSALSLLDHAYGALGKKSAVAISLMLPYQGAPAEEATGYFLEDGTLLPQIAPYPIDAELLGRRLTYVASANNEFISWDGQADPSEELITVPAGQLMFTTAGDGTVMVAAGERTLLYTADQVERTRVYFFESTRTYGEGMTISTLSSTLYPYEIYAPALPVRLVIGGGLLQSVALLPTP